MKRNMLYIIGVLGAFLFAACEHKELCYHHPHTATIRVAFDWLNAPQADPEGMCAFFYPMGEEEEGQPQRFDFAGKTGGEIDIQVGTYRVVCYNNDTEGVLFRGMDGFATHEGYTREGNVLETIYGNAASFAPKAGTAAEDRVTICPDKMWGCHAIDVKIAESGVSYICVLEKEKDNLEVQNTAQVITLRPYELVCTYTYEIRHVTNLKYAEQMCGSLSGMAPSVFFGSDELGRECITVPFEAVSDGISTVTGKFYTFGHHEANAQPHEMLLYVWMKDGSKYYYTFDVTGQIHDAPDCKHVHIVIDGVDLPQPIDDGGGFRPSVDDWLVEEEEIVL